MNELKIQIHYDFYDSNSHLLNYYTRKTCSDAQIKILETILGAVFPSVDYQIFVQPDQEGSFKDNSVVRFLNDNQGALGTPIAAVGLILTMILFTSQMNGDKTSSDVNILDTIQKCRDLGLNETQISLIENEICESYGIKLNKNHFYEAVTNDKSVSEIKPKVCNDSGDVFVDKKITRDEFKAYIEEIPKQKEFISQGQFGNIELSQPFILKQQQYGRGTAWKGVYYGADVIDSETMEVVLVDGEPVYFYMQDAEYKKQIFNQEVAFKSGDNIGVVFDVGRFYDYVNKKYGNPRLYVTKVVSHNDNLIQHKNELRLRKKIRALEEQNKNQQTLF